MPPVEQQHALAARLDTYFSDLPMPGSKTQPNQWHITLRFLGDIGQYEQDRLAFALSEPNDLGGPFVVGLHGLGAFPEPRSASVLWAGVDAGSAELGELVSEIDRRLTDIDFPSEGRPFVPHLSLSHLRPRRDVWRWVERVPEFQVKWSVDTVALVESVHGASGPQYVVIDEVAL